MRHSSSQFCLSLPAPGNSQCFAIGLIGSKTQLSAQRGAHCNSPKLAVPQVVCPLAAPHLGSGPLSWSLPGPVLPALMRSLQGITEPWREATKSLQSPAQEHIIFGTCMANPKMHKYSNQNKALHSYGGKKPKNKMHHLLLICFPFPLYKPSLPRSPKFFPSFFSQFSPAFPPSFLQFFPSDFAAFPVSTNSSQTGSP